MSTSNHLSPAELQIDHTASSPPLAKFEYRFYVQDHMDIPITQDVMKKRNVYVLSRHNG